MIEEVMKGLYRIKVPLSGNPLGFVNSYVIKAERSLIIDTGFNDEDCLNAMQSGLKKLGVDLNSADFFLTHMHADHSGLAARVAAPSSKIYISQKDAETINAIESGEGREAIKSFGYRNGFPEKEMQAAFQKHPGSNYKKIQEDYSTIKDKDVIKIGEYEFECVETPGHSKGHMCLFEPDKKVLISGDHILGDISPNISLWSEDYDPLSDYIKSLDKISKLDVGFVLPGHGDFINDCNQRIRELSLHHVHRNDEILSILAKGDFSAYQIASQMSWNLPESWDNFAEIHKWFAVGETFAHLKFLSGQGTIRKEVQEQKILFKRKK